MTSIVLVALVLLVLVKANDLTFHLLLKDSGNYIQIDVDNASDYIKNDGKIALVLHGWTQNYTYPYITKIIQNLFHKKIKYGIAVDYSKFSDHNYLIAAGTAGVAANGISDFLIQLTKLKISPSDIYLIGHSLGGQVCGLAAQKFYQNRKEKIRTIIALDPAGPLFLGFPKGQRLSEDDAVIVGVIHTSNVLGYALSCGTYDVFPNNGIHQPGCNFTSLDSCSHHRSYELFDFALREKLIAASCDSYEDFVTNKCNGTKTIDLGDISTIATGKFYLSTKATEPYRLTP